MPGVLLIDDEPAITESLDYAFRRAGFEPHAAHSLAAAEALRAAYPPDIVVLDLGLPDGQGLDWLRALRLGGDSTPVIILSSHDEAVDHIVGLEVGADDYVDKPFSPREVVARARAVLRRTGERTAGPGGPTSSPMGSPAAITGFGAASAVPPGGISPSGASSGVRLRVDEARRQAWAFGIEVHLSRTEFDLLVVFLASPGIVFGREQLLDRVWGPDVAVTDRTVDVHIKSLRRKLAGAGLDGEVRETVRGVGYRLAEAEGAP